jgi:hypothetical protein
MFDVKWTAAASIAINEGEERNEFTRWKAISKGGERLRLRGGVRDKA